MGQGFKELAALRNDEKKIEENWNQIDWSKTSKDDSKKESPIEVTQHDTKFVIGVEEETDSFNPLMTVDFEDDRKSISYGVLYKKHAFRFKNNENQSYQYFEPDTFIADILLGIMNEIAVNQMIDLENNK